MKIKMADIYTESEIYQDFFPKSRLTFSMNVVPYSLHFYFTVLSMHKFIIMKRSKGVFELSLKV